MKIADSELSNRAMALFKRAFSDGVTNIKGEEVREYLEFIFREKIEDDVLLRIITSFEDRKLLILDKNSFNLVFITENMIKEIS